MSEPTLHTGPGHRSRWLWRAAAVAYLLGATLLLLVWRLPLERLLRAASRQLEQQTGHEAQFDSAALGWAGAVRLEQLVLHLRLGERSVPVELDRLEARPQWLGTVLGSPAARLRASAYGGRLELRAVASDRRLSSLSQAELRVEGLDLGSAAALAVLTGGRVEGQLDASAELRVAGREPADWSGQARVAATGVYLENVALGGLTLERLPLGRAELELELAAGSGVLQVVRCELSGSEVELSATGSVTLAAALERSRLDLQLRGRLSGQTQASFGELVGLMGYAADEQGWIRVSVGGSLASPRAAPGR